MTVATNVSRADFTITTGTTEYPFTFRIFEDTDLVVILRATDGTVSTLVLNTDYTVDGVGDYNGGKVIVSSQFASDNDGAQLVVRRVLDLVQETSIRNQGKFYPETHENVFDRLTMIDQQQQEQINRSLKYPPAGSSGMSTDLPAPDPGKGLKWNATGDGLENTQHDADAIANIAAQYASQAAQSASDAAESAQDASDTYDDFRGTYYGPLSSDPSTDPLGNPPNPGDMYFNTTTNRLRVYSASGAWIEGAGGSMQTFQLTGDGVKTEFPIPAAPPEQRYADVYIGGIRQQEDTYSFVGSTIVFSEPPPAPEDEGEHNIEIRVIEILPLGETDAALVAYNGGTVADFLLTFPTTAGMGNMVVPATASAFSTRGYYTPGDGGGGTFVGPLESDPGTVDSVEVGYGNSGTRRWFRLVHSGGVCLEQIGIIGDSYDIFDGGTWRDETALFVAAINLAGDLGINKVFSIGGRGIGIQDALISHDVEIDLNGSTLYGNFGAHGFHSVTGAPIYWTRRMMYTVADNPKSVTLRNFRINGQNSPTVLMAGGEVLLDFRGGAAPGNVVVTLENGEITRGANRIYTSGSGVTPPTLIMDYRNMDLLFYNVDLVRITNVEVRSSPAEMISIQSDDGRTVWQIDGLRATKRRDGRSNRWSSSALNVFNCKSGSYLRNSQFWEFVKGPVNIQTDGVEVENCSFVDVQDSSGLDFCEAKSYRQNQIVVRGCYFENIPGIGIRASASNFLSEYNTFKWVNIGHSFEGGVVGNPAKGSWMRADPAPLYNVRVTAPIIITCSGSHTDLICVRAIGASSSMPVHLIVDGGSPYDQALPTRPLYGIHTTHCDLTLFGHHGYGRSALVYMTGFARVRAYGAVFSPEPGQSVHTFHFDGAILGASAVRIEHSSRVTELDAGQYDFRADNGTINRACVNLVDSPDFAGTNNGLAIMRNDEFIGKSDPFNVPSVQPGASTATTVVVMGAQIGDIARATFSINTGGLMMSARVVGPHLVEVRWFNPTDSAIDIGGGVITAFVKPVS